MLCPEVSVFPPPKVYSSQKQNEDLEKVMQLLDMNNFYKSVIVTCPDEHNTAFFQDVISEDSDYYRLYKCPITEFINQDFIGYFVKNGKVTCLSAERNCIIQNCAAITPDGLLTIHVLDFIYQTLGLEGTKRPHGYYEIRIDLKYIKHFERFRNSLSKLELFDFYITWEPSDENVCPSSIAKYFSDKKIQVSVHTMSYEKILPFINQIPTLIDTDIEEIVEWMGMLAHRGDIMPTEEYISSYSEPDCQTFIESTRISVLIIKGFLTPTILGRLCHNLKKYAESRDLDNYWTAMSIQGHEESLWQFTSSSPRMFHSHNSSHTIFIEKNRYTVYSIGQLKYS